MGSKNYEEAIRLIGAHPELASFAGPRSEALVGLAETALGVRFPRDFREFVLRYGAGSFGAAEVYGVVDEEFEHSSVPDGVWGTLSEWGSGGVPRGILVIGATGDGDLYGLDATARDDPPVIILRPGNARSVGEIVSPGFGSYLLGRCREQLDEPSEAPA